MFDLWFQANICFKHMIMNLSQISQKTFTWSHDPCEDFWSTFIKGRCVMRGKSLFRRKEMLLSAQNLFLCRLPCICFHTSSLEKVTSKITPLSDQLDHWIIETFCPFEWGSLLRPFSRSRVGFLKLHFHIPKTQPLAEAKMMHNNNWMPNCTNISGMQRKSEDLSNRWQNGGCTCDCGTRCCCF